MLSKDLTILTIQLHTSIKAATKGLSSIMAHFTFKTTSNKKYPSIPEARYDKDKHSYACNTKETFSP